MGERHVYIRKGIYTIEQVLSKQITPVGNTKRKQNKVDFDGDMIKMDSHRYWVFKVKGVSCAECGIKGLYFAKERDISNQNSETYHFNLYAIDKNGEEIMMTKDHIIPKSRGGKNHIDNYQPMCIKCNVNKGNKMTEELLK